MTPPSQLSFAKMRKALPIALSGPAALLIGNTTAAFWTLAIMRINKG
jgi:hypothetical protein